jgi:hypothetical protein
MSDIIAPRVPRFGPDNLPSNVASAKERLDFLSVEVASIEGNIARLDSMMEDTESDGEYETLSKQRVGAITAKRYGTVEQAWLQAWLRKYDPDEPTRLLKGILMQLVTLTAAVTRLR